MGAHTPTHFDSCHSRLYQQASRANRAAMTKYRPSLRQWDTNTGFLIGKAEFSVSSFSPKRRTLFSPRRITLLLKNLAWAKKHLSFVNTPEPFRFLCFLKIADHAVMANYDLSLGERGHGSGEGLINKSEFPHFSSLESSEQCCLSSFVKNVSIQKSIRNSQACFISHITPPNACNSSGNLRHP